MTGYTIIDADTHVTETPDVWTSRAPASMRDRVPRIETSARGTLRWVLGGGKGMLANPGMTATAGRGSFKNPPKSYEEMHPGAYDPKARLKYMDEMGIWAMVMYPNVGGFGAQQFLKLNDPALMLTCVQIYNDWQTEWSSADSRRLLPITSIHFWDVEAAARRSAPMRRDGPSRNPLHRRAAIFRSAPARRSALESVVGGCVRFRFADQLPCRIRRHDRGFAQEPRFVIWSGAGLHRTGDRYPAPERQTGEPSDHVRRAESLPDDQIRLGLRASRTAPPHRTFSSARV